MTYSLFHLIFILPPILLLALQQPQPLAGVGGRKAGLSLLLIAAVAFIYTTPWDNYLIWRDVWHYGRDRVIGTVGYVPIEEYLFFVLQPILTGLWLYRLLAHTEESGEVKSSLAANIGGTIIWAGLGLAGGWLLQRDFGVYLGLILVWASPILALQWLVGGAQLWVRKRLWLTATLVPTLYLWIADRIAIGQGIWSISEVYTTGLHLFGLPIEEATFFLVTNFLVVQGLLLLLVFSKADKPFLQTESEF
ncbi:lycopene cyclase domain-containing protein [Trichocoleus sp. FACHB-262]|uniref:lycopene cyclase domain-containing protein n=1 Tax=Trichocoleus sp. FACHB-262 TaxID=2692869 RepID=UPI001682F469|nr:lycopene cyclase domain-containing protein [Trichocoleus sp. FACHB-262]MBD2122272.1 lycopene cyclase domain-containing protein [Trichocoleus sp. FACHB-262]